MQQHPYILIRQNTTTQPLTARPDEHRSINPDRPLATVLSTWPRNSNPNTVTQLKRESATLGETADQPHCTAAAEDQPGKASETDDTSHWMTESPQHQERPGNHGRADENPSPRGMLDERFLARIKWWSRHWSNCVIACSSCANRPLRRTDRACSDGTSKLCCP